MGLAQIKCEIFQIMSTPPHSPAFDEVFQSLVNTPTFQNLEKIFLRTLTKQTITNQRIYEGVYPDASKKAHTFISPSTKKLTISRDALIHEIEEEIDSQISEYLQIYFDQHSVQQYLSVCLFLLFSSFLLFFSLLLFTGTPRIFSPHIGFLEKSFTSPKCIFHP